VYEFGNPGMFDGHLDSTVWGTQRGRSKKRRREFILSLTEEESRQQTKLILDILALYDVERTGMFDQILESFGRKPIAKLKDAYNK
jgi:hypothetical protein